jgi:hypothetical protein
VAGLSLVSRVMGKKPAPPKKPCKACGGTGRITGKTGVQYELREEISRPAVATASGS